MEQLYNESGENDFSFREMFEREYQNTYENLLQKSPEELGGLSIKSMVSKLFEPYFLRLNCFSSPDPFQSNKDFYFSRQSPEFLGSMVNHVLEATIEENRIALEESGLGSMVNKALLDIKENPIVLDTTFIF